MHRATASGWSLPASGSQVGDELIRRDAELHAKRLASIKPTINTHAPVPVYTHLTDRRKKAVTEFQRAAVIEHENLLLMSRFRNIIARKQVDNIPSVAAIPRSLNRHYRTTQLTNIVLENEKLINRLVAARGVLTTRKQFEKQAEENEKIVRRHCEYPFQDPLKFRNEYYSDPANPYRNFSGGKERIVRPADESEEEKQNFHHRSFANSRNNSRPQSSYSTHRGSGAAWASRPTSSYSRQPNSGPNASPAAVNSTSPPQPAHTPQSPTHPATHHHHRRPQSAHLHPEQLVAQDPVLLAARRRDVIPRFLPLKLHKDPESLAKKNQEMEKEVAEIEKEEEQRRKKNAPPRGKSASGHRPSHSHRPSTAQHHHTRRQRSPSPHGVHHALPSFEEIRQEDLTNITVRDETESPVPAGSTSSSPVPPSATASASPALPAFPTAPPPLLLFEGAVLISGKLSQVRICEATHPWRIEIQVFDPRTNMEYEIQLPFQQLKPFFLTNPDFFSPADRRKTALVDLLKDGLCFRHVPSDSPNPADTPASADASTPGAGEIELCLDLVQPTPPPAKVIPPSADSVQKKHEELKRERAAALAAAEKDAFKPKTQTIVSPRVKAISSGDSPDSPRSKANYVTRVSSPRSKHSEGLTVPTISQLALGPGMSSRSRSASPRKAMPGFGFGSLNHIEVDEGAEELNDMFVISKQLPNVPFSPTGATGGSDSPSFASMIPLPASPLSIASTSPPIPPVVSIAATPAPPESERLYHIPTHRNKFSLQFQPRTDFFEAPITASVPVQQDTQTTTEIADAASTPVQVEPLSSSIAEEPQSVESEPVVAEPANEAAPETNEAAAVAEEKETAVEPVVVDEKPPSPVTTVSPPLDAPPAAADDATAEVTPEVATEPAPDTQVTAPAVASMMNKSPSQLMAVLLNEGVVDSELVDDLDAIDQLDENEAANYSSKPPSIPTSRNHSRPASARPQSAGTGKPVGGEWNGEMSNLPPLPDSKSISASPRASTLREIEEMDDLTDLAIDDLPISPIKTDEDITTAATV